MTAAGKRLIRAAKEARSIARGEADPATYVLHVPAAVDVKGIRKKQRLTQEQFALRYGLNVARLRDWEQERSTPDSAARAYLTVIEKDPDAVRRALAD